MTHRTVVPVTYDEYLASEYPGASEDSAAAQAVDLKERQARLTAFPHSVVLQVAFPEMDFANRWRWQQFGPPEGECQQVGSEYLACDLPPPHHHNGSWLTFWLAKTDYNFGFNEWCFARLADRDRFLEFIPQINWGESYPK
jgi:hypothetical protein